MRVLAWTLSVLLVLVTGVVFGVAWYFSGIALGVDRTGGLSTEVRAGPPGTGGTSGTSGTIVLAGGGQDAWQGLHGVRWAGGWGVAGEVLARPDGLGGPVVREWEDRSGTLPLTPVAGRMDQDVFLDDPSAVGLPFSEVVLTSDLGDLPTWLVPAPADPSPAQAAAEDTWVVFAHGRGGQREEANRYLPLWHDLGHPVLVPSYRNDAGAPASADGRYALGGTEWRDVDAAVEHALEHGAERVVLAGWSMGGAIVMQVLDRSEHADAVAAVVLDAPVLDWRDTLEHQAGLVGLPGWWTDLAVDLTALRSGTDLDDFDWAARAEEVDVPVYLVHSDDDQLVPNGPSRAFAAATPELTTAHFEGPALHTREWNVDPAGYEQRMRTWFLDQARTGWQAGSS